MKRRCVNCGIIFETNGSFTLCCSPKCNIDHLKKTFGIDITFINKEELHDS